MDTVRTDVLVIGGGCAGMAAAIAAREKGAESVMIRDTVLMSESSSGFTSL